MSDYEAIALGGGSPGEHCAGALAEGGLRAAIVERELVGGETATYTHAYAEASGFLTLLSDEIYVAVLKSLRRKSPRLRRRRARNRRGRAEPTEAPGRRSQSRRDLS